MVGTLPPSLVELRRTQSLCPPYGLSLRRPVPWVFQLHRDEIGRARPIAGCNSLQGVVQRFRWLPIRRQMAAGVPPASSSRLHRARYEGRCGFVGRRLCLQTSPPATDRSATRRHHQRQRYFVDAFLELDAEPLMRPECSGVADRGQCERPRELERIALVTCVPIGAARSPGRRRAPCRVRQSPRPASATSASTP